MTATVADVEFKVGDAVAVWSPLLFELAPAPRAPRPPWRPPAGALRDRGVTSADDPRNSSEAHTAVLRAIAANIALGGWCDALAWSDVTNPLVSVGVVADVEPEPELFPT